MNVPTGQADSLAQSDIFCEIGKALTSSLNPTEVFNRVMKIIGDYFSPRNWSLLLMEEDTERLRFEIVMGVDADKLEQVHIGKGEGIVGWVCLNGQPIIVEDTQNDPRFSPRVDQILNFTTRSIVCVPVLNGSNCVVGAIELINKIVPPSAKTALGRSAQEVTPNGDSFTGTDMKILAAIGAFTGIAAENAFLHQKVKELAMIDSLTGINNRHYFNEMLRCETERAKRYQHTLAMLMVDVDEFKAINDTFGHLTGDKVLCTIADILRTSVRESDVLARFGGDEFVILMPFASEGDGLQLAQRIQTLIQEWNDKALITGLNLAVSIGVHAAGPREVDTLLLKADHNLYQYKSLRKKAQELTGEGEMRRYLWHTNFSQD